MLFASLSVVGLPPDSYISDVASVSAAGGIPSVASASALAGVYPGVHALAGVSDYQLTAIGPVHCICRFE